jgi:hypothetical protein
VDLGLELDLDVEIELQSQSKLLAASVPTTFAFTTRESTKCISNRISNLSDRLANLVHCLSCSVLHHVSRSAEEFPTW